MDNHNINPQLREAMNDKQFNTFNNFKSHWEGDTEFNADEKKMIGTQQNELKFLR